MKRSLKAREVAFVLLPALGLGAFAWYQKRIETVGEPRRADGLFVQRVEVTPAKGRFQAKGLSHEVKVVIGHSWPRPAWWGEWKLQTGVDVLHDAGQPPGDQTFSRQQIIAYGAALTTTSMRNGRPVIKRQWRDNRIGVPLVDNQLVFSHQMALDKIPLSAGEVTFRGVYYVGAQQPIRVTRVVRRNGERLVANANRDPGGHIVSIKADPFDKTFFPPSKVADDSCKVWFVVASVAPASENPKVQVQELELRDGRGKILKPYSTPGFRSSWSWISQSGIQQPVINLYLNPTLKTTHPLTFRGQVSIDEGWPIPFSVQLPPR